MKRVVIVGAGPVGLYTAIKLKQRGVDVTVIDPRADNYTRPGIISGMVFMDLEEHLGQPLEYDSHHIKDVERSLYKIASALHIDIQKYTFQTLTDHGVIAADSQKTPISLACDLVIDCSGSKRVVMSDINRRHTDPPFKLQAIAPNSLKNHFIAYITMPTEDAALLDTPLPTQTDPRTHTQALERLRLQFGWPEFSEPYLMHQTLDKNKVCLYFETPPGLQADQQEAWVQALLQLKTGKDTVSFAQTPLKSGKKKPKFTAFILDPHKATLFAHQESNLPMVIPLGDSQIDPDYRLGIGIVSGVTRVDAWIQSLTIESGVITTIDLELYTAQLQPLLAEFEHEIITSIRARHYQLECDLKTAEQRYQRALAASTEPAERQSIQAGLEEIHYRRTMQYYQKGLEGYQNTLDSDRNIALDAYGNITHELLLARSQKALLKALASIPESHAIEREKIRATLQDMADKYTQLSKRLSALNKPVNSEAYSQKAFVLQEQLSESAQRPRLHR
ncbi:MAG: hypothetical protein A3E83_03595 [Gammaproteobacteria bacterium RIFCSPHIGHO2_12_FULL_41_20]|nr:MAG: hypothetical protein A3E83_03595 [Gammaproteobacteria bacterium RIFCSPHIGHO2_12_FULL_41_20]